MREDHAEAQRDFSRDLFLWAVVQNNKELAEIAWEQVIFYRRMSGDSCLCSVCKWPCIPLSLCSQCRDCISAALAASKILKKMAKEESDPDEAVDMRELANHYETHAIGIKRLLSDPLDVNIGIFAG